LTRIILFLLVAIGGAGLTLQMAWNARLRTATGSPVLTTMISVCITLILLIGAGERSGKSRFNSSI